MQVGMIGLGRMGANMVRRLLRGGHQCVVHDVSAAAVEALAREGATGAASVDDFVARLAPPRVVWLMVPAAAVDATLETIAPRLAAGDVIVDGGNSYYRDDIARAARLAPRGLHYVDCGTSGGVWGLERGYCLMIGGEPEIVARLDPLFRTLAPGRSAAPPTPGRPARRGTAEEGYLHCGPHGAGHFVKMVHNGIEYGMLQAYGEGFEIMHASEYDLDLHRISQIWQHGSVVRSWLLELAELAFAKEPDLKSVRGYVDDSGEGRWTVQEAIEKSVPAPVITLSLLARFNSRQEESFSAQVIAALRNEFGGHAIHRE